MSLYLRLLPGVKIRLGRRGVRWGLGPHWLRFHTGGGGGDGISTGAGPLTLYEPLRSRRRRRRRQPGSPGGSHPVILGALALLSFTWPWLVLHGVAMVVVGVLWTLLLLLAATAVMAGRRDRRRSR